MDEILKQKILTEIQPTTKDTRHGMLGKHHTEEARKKMRRKFTDEHKRKLSLAHIGIQAGKNHPMYGKHHTKESNEKNRIKHLGKATTPRKIIPKKILEELYIKQKLPMEKIAEQLSVSISAVWRNLRNYKIPIRSLSESHIGQKAWNKGIPMREISKKKLIEARKHQNIPTSKTKPENEFIKICNKYQLPYRFTGNGSFWIEKINPDFVEANGKKIAVEIFGGFWHNPFLNKDVSYERSWEGREKILKKYGWKLIVIWESEIMSDYGEEITLIKLDYIDKIRGDLIAKIE